MNEGRIEQVGAPQDIYLDPQSLFVADFVGETNVLAGARPNGAVHLAAGADFNAPGAEGAVRAVIRPEAVRQGARRRSRCRPASPTSCSSATR